MKVCVFGAGYVGLVTAACLAEMGNSVIGVDIDTDRVAQLERGLMPIHEPGLDTLVSRNLAAGRLRFTTDVALGVSHGTLIFIAVGTPPAEDGSADLQHVLGVAASIGRHMNDYKVIIDKSTVPVGTADAVRTRVQEELERRATIVPFAMVSNPEFLKEGAAIDDFMRPDRVVIGCESEQSEHLMRALYAPFLRNRDRIISMDVRSAELTKYVANAMLATRISFMNEMARLADKLGADIEMVRMGVGSDRRIGSHFLYAGCGWGGSCFPKDLDALDRMGITADEPLSIVRSVRQVNDAQRRLLGQRIVARFGQHLSGLHFAVWGLAFKPETDDMRQAPSVDLIDELLARGGSVSAYDPAAREHAARRWAGQSGFALADDPVSACSGADALAIVTEWREFRSPDFPQIAAQMKQRVIFDGRNLFDPQFLADSGFEYSGIGRRQIVAPVNDSVPPALTERIAA